MYSIILFKKKNYKIQSYNFYMYSYKARKPVYNSLSQRGEIKRKIGKDD